MGLGIGGCSRNPLKGYMSRYGAIRCAVVYIYIYADENIEGVKGTLKEGTGLWGFRIQGWGCGPKKGWAMGEMGVR